MTPYDEGLEQRKKWVLGAEAEHLGYLTARLWDKPMLDLSHDPYIQQRMEQGFADGKALLVQSEVKA